MLTFQAHFLNNMENAEEIFHFLEDFSKRKPKVIPQELNDYLAYVARTGDPVYQWSLVKSLFKEKLLNVITDFYETTPSIEIPPYPNVDPFNYDAMKNSLLERLDSFSSAPFTVQRICELLTYPRKQYNRVDKFMRAVEKNILVVSTREPGTQRHVEPENGEPVEAIVNGSDNNSEYNVDVEMEDMSWKDNPEQQQNATPQPQPCSSETHISVDDIEARLQAKEESPMQSQEKTVTQYESVTPPEPNVTTEEQEMKSTTDPVSAVQVDVGQSNEKPEAENVPPVAEEPKLDVEMTPVETEEQDPLIIPEIKVDDAEMTEQRLAEESNNAVDKDKDPIVEKEEQQSTTEDESNEKPAATEDSTSSDTNTKDEVDSKATSEVLTSSEESSSSSDNTNSNSNSPKPSESNIDSLEESNSDSSQAESNVDSETKSESSQEPKPIGDTVVEAPQIQSDNYSISDVKSELPEPVSEGPKEPEEPKEETKEAESVEEKEKKPEKTESPEVSSEN
ncbi:serine/threonine-protein phosphatase 4 regulatory subunit 2 [Pectinophora gossypiella]|uniref:serine/threonine-protein phosphatase 4 regulatory subunit 2 n=1 Tax=Pectinophora gossypiella TaxID=13191 RepID=UPI00214E68FF|nr:serine/threonine-protein phosphatase 4 regulatory subunit 2 [Pectinophora gossypiella]